MRARKPHRLPAQEANPAICAQPVNTLHNDSEPSLTEPEPRAVSVKPDPVKPIMTPKVDPIDEWTTRILRNMKRMATDEAYRKSIAQKLS